MQVKVDHKQQVAIVTINRPERRNAVDAATALALHDAFTALDADDSVHVAILHGAGGHFCAGADLKALSEGDRRPVTDAGMAPMGPTRMQLTKPVIAAIEGYAVAGGMELALWCDMRVMAETARMGVFCRRFGVPLVDMGTIRLPRLIGHSRAMDLMLTGREVGAAEAQRWGSPTASPGTAVRSSSRSSSPARSRPSRSNACAMIAPARSRNGRCPRPKRLRWKPGWGARRSPAARR